MNRLWLLLLLTNACATHHPKQLGGLGVFNPHGFEHRLYERTRLDAKNEGNRAGPPGSPASATASGLRSKVADVSKK